MLGFGLRPNRAPRALAARRLPGGRITLEWAGSGGVQVIHSRTVSQGGTRNRVARFLGTACALKTWVSVMRALNAIVTAAGFAAIFAFLILTSAVVTATVHKALASIADVEKRS